MHEELLRRLSEITSEEQALLRGEKLDLTLYNAAGDAVMDPGVLLPGGELFGIRRHTRFVDFPLHSHAYVEMIYQVRGSTTHLIDGKEPLCLEEGHLLLLSRGSSHAIRACGKDDLAVNFILIPLFFDNAAVSMDQPNALSAFLNGNLARHDVPDSHLLFDVSGSITAQNLLENLVLSALQNGPIRLQQLTLELLLLELSHMADRLVIQSREDREQAMVMSVLDQIERHLQCNLSEVARTMGVSDSHLSRIIRQRTGCTFTELLHTARFSRASVLLRDTSLSVEDVAAAVGYQNLSFFYRQFAARYGCTPRQYRQQRTARSDT